MFSDNIAVKVIHVMRLSRSRRVSFPTTGRDFSVLSYRKTGETVFYQAGRAYEANGKSIAFIPQNLSYSQVSGNEDLIAVHFEIYGSVPDSVAVFCPESCNAYEPLFEEILNEWENKEIGYAHRCNSVLSSILYTIEKERFRRGTDNIYDIASRAAAIIEKHLGDSGFALAEISGMLKISDAYFRINFKNKFGITPKEYQTSLRLKHARMLLETQYLPIKDISHKCGFSNEKYFSALFKRHFGTSPKFFRGSAQMD